MPQSHNIIATKTVSGEINIYDYFKHPAKPQVAGEVKAPQLRLVGHEREGYGLAWSHRKEGMLVSGSDDGIICVWDIN
jgi:histone-binding protein RBBP4